MTRWQDIKKWFSSFGETEDMIYNPGTRRWEYKRGHSPEETEA